MDLGLERKITFKNNLSSHQGLDNIHQNICMLLQETGVFLKAQEEIKCKVRIQLVQDNTTYSSNSQHGHSNLKANTAQSKSIILMLPQVLIKFLTPNQKDQRCLEK